VAITPIPPAKARLAGLVAHRDPADPAITEARRDLKAAGLQARIARDVASWPPLTPSQRTELAIQLLTPAGGDDHAAT
jgi:hypothetical protein